VSYMKRISIAIQLTYPKMYKEIRDDINNVIHCKYKELKLPESKIILDQVKEDIKNNVQY